MVQAFPQQVDLVGQSSQYLEINDGCPRLRAPSSLLPVNGEIALGYLALGYWPIPLIQNSDGAWVPAVRWKAYQEQAPTTQQIADWWMCYPDAGIALMCGHTAGLVTVDIDPRHGGIDPGLSAPGCSTPRGGIHYHLVAPEPIPQLHATGVEVLGDRHMARVPPTPGYAWLNGGLPQRAACYELGQLPPTR